jgi:hypothetical protein
MGRKYQRRRLGRAFAGNLAADHSDFVRARPAGAARLLSPACVNFPRSRLGARLHVNEPIEPHGVVVHRGISNRKGGDFDYV